MVNSAQMQISFWNLSTVDQDRETKEEIIKKIAIKKAEDKNILEKDN